MSQVPFPDTPGRVTPGLECLGQRDFPLRDPSLGIREKDSPLVAAHATAGRQSAGHQSCPAGGADRGGRIELGQLHPLACHPVQFRRPDRGMSETAQVTVSQVICKYDDHVRG